MGGLTPICGIAKGLGGEGGGRSSSLLWGGPSLFVILSLLIVSPRKHTSWPRLTPAVGVGGGGGGRNEIQPGNCSRPDLIYCSVAGVHMADGAKSSSGH